MILLDTNVIIDARDRASSFHRWAEEAIVAALTAEGAAINAIVLAELCVGHADPDSVEDDLRSLGLNILDIPTAASAICGRAYTNYRRARRKSRGGSAPAVPLPDFFIGAHAQLMRWRLATRDPERFRVYFPEVELIAPGHIV